MSLFLVDTAQSPVRRGGSLDKVGQTEAETSELFFDDDVLVPADNLLGQPGEGFGYLMDRLAQERLSCAIASLAHARAALEFTFDYVPAPVRIRSTDRLLAGHPFSAGGLPDRTRRRVRLRRPMPRRDIAGALTPVDAAKAKLTATEIQNQIIDHCLQLHGGYGYMREYRIARWWQDARVTRIFGGTSEVMREIIGRSLPLSAD